MSDAAAAAADSYSRAMTAWRGGDAKAALSGFLMALALAPDTLAYRRAAVNLLGVTSGYKTLPSPVMAALRHCASDPALDIQPLSLVVKTIFEADPRFATLERSLDGSGDEIENHIQSGAYDWFLAEPLLHGVLARATIISTRLEDALTKLRRHFLLHPSTALVARHERFVAALALQANHTRFPWAESDAERAKLEDLEPNATLSRAPYRPFSTISDHAAASLPDVLRVARTLQLELTERTRRMPALTPVDNAISRKVQTQYEQFPYPPWDTLTETTPTTWARFRRERFPQFDLCDAIQPRFLSAGCGTGRGAIMLAITFPEAQITALDLSRTSLAYAALKAEQHRVQNISFGLGDILNVGGLGQTFDFIESAGVLHHMAVPLAGLKALAAVLKPGGLMRLALYSERGRTAVVAARAAIAQARLPDSDEGVRAARTLLRALPHDHPAFAVTQTPEFFTLDGLHDLIFNVQETRYTPRDLKMLLADAGLAFLGFDHANPATAARYAEAHPADPTSLDLGAWDAFEKNNPETFAEMYQFWCLKPAS